jgi:hypothetical protein
LVSFTVKFKFAVAILKMVATDNFEMSTYRLSSDYSASELRGNIWWSLMESNHLPATPLNNGYRVTAGNGEQAPIF